VAVEETVIELIETAEKQRAANHDLRHCVQDAVQKKLEEDKEELEEIKRRSISIIIHGLTELVDTDKNVRQKHNDDELQEILHQINNVMTCRCRTSRDKESSTAPPKYSQTNQSGIDI